MKAHLTVFALAAILVASVGMAPAFGQIQDPITVATDKSSYAQGDAIIVTGEVRDLYSGNPIALVITAPDGKTIVGVAQPQVGADKMFSYEFTAGGIMKNKGTYTINAVYGTDTRATTMTFEYEGSAIIKQITNSSSTTGSIITETTVLVQGSNDLIHYEITGGKLTGVTPNVEVNSLIISIDATDDGVLKLIIPRSILDATIDGVDDEFTVLVDLEQDGDFGLIREATDNTFTIKFLAGAEEIEIIGTWVIPEFGTIAAMILAVAIISIIAISAKSRLSIIPRY